MEPNPDTAWVPRSRSLVLTLLLAAAAGGLAWGIRGQYGHETGAMLAGVLGGLAMLWCIVPAMPVLQAWRAVALFTLGISLGGSMTYGQTLGLSHDPELVGNHAALAWSLLGLALKGGLWWGLGGAFLGLGLSRVDYSPRRVLWLWLFMAAAYVLGVWLLNRPFDASRETLPAVYFSGSSFWKPGGWKPRPECWGGYLLALAVLGLATRLFYRDPLPLRLGLWGAVGGGLGFPLGQVPQALHAWQPEAMAARLPAWLLPHINWWNLMEMSFGAIACAVLALGVWYNRGRLAAEPGWLEDRTRLPVAWSPGVEWALILVHLALLVGAEFGDHPLLELYTEYGLLLILIPLLGVAAGRWWPPWLIFVGALIPYAGKTARDLAFRSQELDPLVALGGLVVFPVLAMLGWTFLGAASRRQRGAAEPLLRWSLLGLTWLYFGLNFVIFRWPWPWSVQWNYRTPSAAVMLLLAATLTLAALWPQERRSREQGVPAR